MTAAAKLALAALVVATLIAAGCGTPRWQERGFDSESECWLHHGWDGSVRDGVDRNEMFDFWCD